MSIDTPPITPQQYEVLHGGGAEAAQIANQRLYRRRVHLGCTVPFRNDCNSFKCPCHGSHYNVDGEYLDGPAPRSLDRFAMSFSGTDVIVSTGTLNNTVPHPDASTRLIQVPTEVCA